MAIKITIKAIKKEKIRKNSSHLLNISDLLQNYDTTIIYSKNLKPLYSFTELEVSKFIVIFIY